MQLRGCFVAIAAAAFAASAKDRYAATLRSWLLVAAAPCFARLGRRVAAAKASHQSYSY